jgi:hypothetical protein
MKKNATVQPSQEMMLKRQIAALQIRIGRGRAAIKSLDLPQ